MSIHKKSRRDIIQNSFFSCTYSCNYAVDPALQSSRFKFQTRPLRHHYTTTFQIIIILCRWPPTVEPPPQQPKRELRKFILTNIILIMSDRRRQTRIRCKIYYYYVYYYIYYTDDFRLTRPSDVFPAFRSPSNHSAENILSISTWRGYIFTSTFSFRSKRRSNKHANDVEQ